MKCRNPSAWLGAPVLSLACLLIPQARAAALPPPVLAQLNVDIELGAPPPPRHEIFNERDRPSRDHVWVKGYWANHHGRHDWVAGRWEVPPHGRTEWIEPRWEKRGHGYVFVDGYWAEPHHHR